jgi:peptidoglycan/xylan/chitin deacetylase (PgdA/CDA1 family)
MRWFAVALLAALLAAPAVASPAGPRTLDVPILMYHRIDYLRPTLPAITRRLTVDPGDFAHQMAWLKSHRYHSITQEQLLAALRDGRPLPSKPVLITFDDGYRDVLGKASPVIRRLGLRATEYVITSRLHGTDPSFLTVPQLRVLEQRGIEIGSHTVTHADLPTLSNAQAFEELTASKRTLERAVGHPVPWFAYPYGAYDSQVVALVARAGYELAVTTQGGSCQSSAQPLELKRLEVLDSTGVAGFAAMLQEGRC